ncbi:flagellar protein FlaG [Shewanella sp. Arc9-LZ]|jgi:flagellar protein FlaG|uniref:flagellar protein FlaG n=1 Tax=Shewanella sp. Arc9-LZ TaxID=2698686 RepID=UPI00137C2412|nr:flagellar protein FlaG [Shewanella sp. Arc9-LZ]QHS12790.1 flagellar protein FlaG [Shewanella sp. Arc9-LZ]
MDIQTITSSTNFINKVESTNVDLNKSQVTDNISETNQLVLDKESSIQVAQDAEETQQATQKKNENLIQVANELTEMMAVMQKGLKFSVDEESGKQVIKVQDVSSGDIIRQIPSEEALKLAEKLSEVSGILMKIEV